MNRSSSSHDREGVVVDVNTPLFEMPPTDFAYWIGKFILEVRKTDGSEYPPKSLYALVCCFKRFFEQNGIHGINPISTSDVHFGDFRATLDSEMKRLYRLGLGMNSKQAKPIMDEGKLCFGLVASWTPTLLMLCSIQCTTIAKFLACALMMSTPMCPVSERG